MISRALRLSSGFAFLLTGVGTALPGATLPAILHQFALSDRAGGTLLLASWGGSTSGALLARGRLGLRASVGLLLSAAALLLLGIQAHIGLAWLYFGFGVGLGLTMTAVSLLCSRAAEAPTTAQVELNRLNLLWAVGACLTPALALHSLQRLSFQRLFWILGGVFLLSALLLASGALTAGEHRPPATAQVSAPLPWAPLRFCLFAAAAVGLESAIGSWLTTYAERSTVGVGVAVSANSAFWLGLLLSRAAHSVPGWPALHSRHVRMAHLGAVASAIVLLLLRPSMAILPGAALLCGFGLGPLYPYLLAVTLPRYRSVAVFVIAGVGASTVPYLTGVLSSAVGMLRVGMLVPAATVCVLVATMVAIERGEAAEVR